MRVQILSDLHFEFDRDGGEAFARAVPVAGDVLVLAGDLIPLRVADEVRRAFDGFCSRFPHVVFVPGNHEYYGTRPADAEAVLAGCAQALPNLHVLNPGVAAIDGTRFVGAALWFPADARRGEVSPPAQRLPADRRLRAVGARHPCRAPWRSSRPRCARATSWSPTTCPTRAASRSSTSTRRSTGSSWPPTRPGASSTPARGCGFHGHTHVACDYVVGATRVVCNPRGYPGEGLTAVDTALVVEV